MDNSTLDGIPWTEVNCADGSICGYITSLESERLQEHQLYHEHTAARIGVSVHGLANVISYGYIGSLLIDFSKFDLI